MTLGLHLKFAFSLQRISGVMLPLHAKPVGIIQTIKGITLGLVDVIKLDALEVSNALTVIVFRFQLVIQFFAKQDTNAKIMLVWKFHHNALEAAIAIMGKFAIKVSVD